MDKEKMDHVLLRDDFIAYIKNRPAEALSDVFQYAFAPLYGSVMDTELHTKSREVASLLESAMAVFTNTSLTAPSKRAMCAYHIQIALPIMEYIAKKEQIII